ncbi:MAG TPA: hypothetical protein VF590_00065, partial [Isosphaeraceae bacterium]
MKDPSDREAKAQFLVVTKDPMPGLRVEPEGGESSPSQVEPLGEPGPDGRPRPFGVRCRPGRPI